MGGYTPKDLAGKLAKSFLNNPITPLLAIFLFAVGHLSLMITPREEDPQMQISGGAVIVAMPGADAQKVRNIVIKPLERKLREIKGIKEIEGIAKNDVGIINVHYYLGQDREESNLKLYDKVMQNIDILPKGARQPVIKPFDIDIDVPILTTAFYARQDAELTQTQLFEQVRQVQHEINAIENVSKTTLKGEQRPQFNILIDPHRLGSYNLSLQMVQKQLRSLSSTAPNADIKSTDGSLTVFGVQDAIEDKGDIENIIIAMHSGKPVYLSDVATVRFGPDISNFKQSYLVHKKSDMPETVQQVTLEVSKLKGTNAVFVAEDFRQKMQKLGPKLQEKGIGYIITRDYGKRANASVNRLVTNLAISMVIVVGLLVFILGWKESLIVAFTVPAIFAVTIFVAYMTDQTINRITLFAFMVALGMLVDAAIIVVENIHRHLHEHESRDKDIDTIVVEATDEIGPATNVATVAIILTMVPMAFVGQMMGQFMKPIPLNVPVALFASLVIAYIFAPYLAKRMLKKPKGGAS
ncbi:MAG: efflux RND transporter permease subunit [Campylobacterota bacterium]